MKPMKENSRWLHVSDDESVLLSDRDKLLFLRAISSASDFTSTARYKS